MKTLVDQQLVKNDCGISAIKTICNVYKVDISREYIKNNLPVEDKGTKFIDVKDFLDNHGFTTSFKLMSVEEEDQNTRYLKKSLPFIAVIKKNDELHYIIIVEINKKKLRILDPAKPFSYTLTLKELEGKLYQSYSYVKQLDVDEKIKLLIDEELTKNGLDRSSALIHNNLAELYNKVAYYSYLRDNYGFKTKQSEVNFLRDLIENGDKNTIPRRFQNLKIKGDLIQIESPLILSIKKNAEHKKINANIQLKDESIYLKLFNSVIHIRKLWGIYLLAAFLAATTTQLLVFINQILIDDVLPSFQPNILLVFIIGVAIFHLFDLIINQYREWVAIHLSNALDKYFLSIFDNKLNIFSIAYIQSFKRGDLLERLNDSRQLKMFFVQFFTRILVDSVVAVYSIAILFIINWRVAIIVIIALALFYIWFIKITPFLKTNEQIRFQNKADLFSKFIEKIEGLQVIKSFKIEPIISEKILKSINSLIQLQNKLQFINLLNTTVVSLIIMSASLLVIVFLSRESILYQTITLGQIVTFIMLSNRVFGSLGRLLKDNLSLQENEVILKRFFDFQENQKAPSQSVIQSFEIDELNIDKVNFGYTSGNLILKEINLRVTKGEKIRVFGKNGSGKSTLAKLISLLYEPSAGVININDIKSILLDREQIRKKILLVCHDDLLFNDTLLFNISLGYSISVKDVIALAKQIDFYDVVTSHEEGLDFIISENGKNLSTGQKRKILILRALLSTSEVVIFDEVLSGLDENSRVAVEQILNTLKKTLIIISHEDVKNIKFDKQFLIENGELREI
jgi:subfamily B ATP-binding cassette protein HlyB/CyaB